MNNNEDHTTCNNPNCIDADCIREHDKINPHHYKDHRSGVECITLSEQMNFCLGNAFKYLFRCGLKGNALEDLEKARWYLVRELSSRRNGWWAKLWHGNYDMFSQAPLQMVAVHEHEHRYSGHMAAALREVWDASQCPDLRKHVDRAIESVDKMIRIEKFRQGIPYPTKQ